MGRIGRASYCVSAAGVGRYSSTFFRAKLSRFHMENETESNHQNVVFLNKVQDD
jgi:hypothetical protein